MLYREYYYFLVRFERNVFMSNTVLAGLVTVAALLPIVISVLAVLTIDNFNSGEYFIKLAAVLLWLTALCFFGVIGVVLDQHFPHNDNTVFYWGVGVILDMFSVWFMWIVLETA